MEGAHRPPRMVCPPADTGRAAVLPGRQAPSPTPAGHRSPSGGHAPAAGRSPAVDDRLAPPETRVEYLRGVELFAAPADEPHASHHSQIDRVVGAHVKSPYAIAVDMLTRVDDASDFAPDVSVYKPLLDPETHLKIGRQLEELAFEVVDKQGQAVPTRKALDLVARGVRRVFCVFVKDRTLSEWSRQHGRWEPIPPSAVIDDPCFVRPIRAEALVSSVLADDEVARALLVKRPPAIEAALTESRAAGVAEGRAAGVTEGRAAGVTEGRAEGQLDEKRRGILRILEARGLDVSKRVRHALESTSDPAQLDRWFAEALTVKKASQLVGPKR